MMFQKLLRKLTKSAPHNVIVVGVDYKSFTLHNLIKMGTGFLNINFIDDNPWSHKTLLDGVLLRYPNEIIALSEKHQVKAILCVEQEDFEKIHAVIAPASFNVKVLLLEPAQMNSLDALENFLHASIAAI